MEKGQGSIHNTNKKGMTQSAVEWLVNEANLLENNGWILPLIEKAKEMEKQQIKNAYWDGGQDVPLTENRCEQYYNETFNK
jgi:hypothetical protein